MQEWQKALSNQCHFADCVSASPLKHREVFHRWLPTCYKLARAKLAFCYPTVSMATPEQCKSYAAECHRMAETAASREQKTILLELALEWEAMVKHAAMPRRRET